MEERERDVFGWLDGVRARPSMYLRNNALRDLELLVRGYYAGLRVHGVAEAVPPMGRHFLDWLHSRTGWSCGCGWAYAIGQQHPEPDAALAAFFAFVDEYRHLRPTALCTVSLGAGHDPTGARVRYGLDGRMETPRRVEVVRDRPTRLHFLRFHYVDRVEDGDLLLTGTGECDNRSVRQGMGT